MSGTYTASLEDMQAWARGLMQVRQPDFVIGDDYMRRWWVIPRNDMSNLYLHFMQADDDDRALHDHPWENKSIILHGGYTEITPEGTFERNPGDVIARPAEAAHRLIMRRDDAGKIIPCISLFQTGPTIREWGFHCPQGWRHWRDFVDARDTGQVGRGCGEMDASEPSTQTHTTKKKGE